VLTPDKSLEHGQFSLLAQKCRLLIGSPQHATATGEGAFTPSITSPGPSLASPTEVGPSAHSPFIWSNHGPRNRLGWSLLPSVLSDVTALWRMLFGLLGI
jgi:hypothetical protein